MNIPTKYKGDLRARIIENINTETGKPEYYAQLRLSEQKWEVGLPTQYAYDVKYFNGVNFDFFKKLEEGALKMCKGELALSDLESFLLE